MQPQGQLDRSRSSQKIYTHARNISCDQHFIRLLRDVIVLCTRNLYNISCLTCNSTKIRHSRSDTTNVDGKRAKHIYRCLFLGWVVQSICVQCSIIQLQKVVKCYRIYKMLVFGMKMPAQHPTQSSDDRSTDRHRYQWSSLRCWLESNINGVSITLRYIILYCR